jgi:hypothetical protein
LVKAPFEQLQSENAQLKEKMQHMQLSNQESHKVAAENEAFMEKYFKETEAKVIFISADEPNR